MSGSNKPLVSVIVPHYNGRKYIRQAIQSIRRQTYPNIEIVVVDDASPDARHSECVRQLSEEIGFKLVTHSANQGIGPAMADGVEASCGEFIAELSQDDLYKPQKIEKQMQSIAEGQYDAVYAAGDSIDLSNGRREVRDTKQVSGIIQSGRAADYLLRQNLSGLSIQGLLAKRSVFEEDVLPIWRDFLLDDWPVNIRLFQKRRVGFIEQPLWTCRRHDTNTSCYIWKWFGPQLEVVARLTPDDMKAESIGNRIGSMARRIQQQNGSHQEIMRLALAALMLVDSPKQAQKISRILRKMPSNEKNTFIHSCCELFTGGCRPAADTIPPEKPQNTSWDALGRQIAEIAKACPEGVRVSEIGKVFTGIGQNLLRQNPNLAAEVSMKMILAGLLMIERPEDKMQHLKTLRSMERSAPLIKTRLAVLRSQTAFSFRSLFRQKPAFLSNLPYRFSDEG